MKVKSLTKHPPDTSRETQTTTRVRLPKFNTRHGEKELVQNDSVDSETCRTHNDVDDVCRLTVRCRFAENNGAKSVQIERLHGIHRFWGKGERGQIELTMSDKPLND